MKINEIEENTTYYSGISKEMYKKYWANFKSTAMDRLTNVSTNYEFAEDYSWDGTVIKISNVPLDAIVGVRSDEYEDDDDWIDVSNLTDEEKSKLHYEYNLFLLNLYPYKNQISIKII